MRLERHFCLARRARAAYDAPGVISLGAVAATVQLIPRDPRAVELLKELEARTGAHPREVEEPSGSRTYDLDAARMSKDGLAETLDGIDRDWREHLSRRP